MPVQTRPTLQAAAILIRDESVAAANTALRVGGLLLDMVDSLALLTEIASGLGGWTDDGAVVRLTTASDNVALGAAAMVGSEKLRVVGGTRLEGQVDITGSNALRFGSTPASAGRARFTLGDELRWRNIANSSDIVGLSVIDGGGFGNELIVGGNGAGLRPDSVVLDSVAGTILNVNGVAKFACNALLASLAVPLAFGLAAATTGDIRAPHNWSLRARNNGNSADRALLAWGAVTDVLELGDGTTPIRIRGLAGSVSLFSVNTSILSVNANGVTIDNGNGLTWSTGATPLISQANISGAVHDFTIRAQGRITTTGNGAALNFDGGRHTTGLPGAVRMRINPDDAAPLTMVEVASVVTNSRIVALCRRANITTAEMPSGTGDGVVFLADANVSPSVPPVGGGILCSSVGSLLWDDPTGVRTQLSYTDGTTGGTTKARYRRVRRVQTTNATPTVITEIPISDESVAQFAIRVQGFATASSEAGYRLEVVVSRRGAADPQIVGTPVKESFEDVAGWDVNAVVNTTNDTIEIQVTGAAATTIDWLCWIDQYEWNP